MLSSLNFCPKMMGKAAKRTEMPDPKQTREETWLCHSSAPPLKTLGIALMTIPLSCFCFIFIKSYNFICNHKQLQELESPAPNSWARLLPSFFWVHKGRKWEREIPAETKGWSYPTQGSPGWGPQSHGKSSSFPGSCSTTYGQKDCISLEDLGMAEFLHPCCSRRIACVAAPAAWSARGAAGLEALCISLI